MSQETRQIYRESLDKKSASVWWAKFNTQNLLFFFWTLSCMVRTQIGRKILGGHHACLGDIMQNIAITNGRLLLVFRQEPGTSFTIE